MKKTFSISTFFVAWVGMLIIIVLAIPSQNNYSSISYNYDYSQDPRYKGQVKSASTTDSVTTFTEISVSDVLSLINHKDPNTILIDVSNVYRSGHIPGAISFPLKDVDKLALGMDKNKNYIVYCHNNTDSLIAIQKLVNFGFQKLFRISGGYNSWVKSKYKIEK